MGKKGKMGYHDCARTSSHCGRCRDREGHPKNELFQINVLVLHGLLPIRCRKSHRTESCTDLRKAVPGKTGDSPCILYNAYQSENITDHRHHDGDIRVPRQTHFKLRLRKKETLEARDVLPLRVSPAAVYCEH